MRTVHRMRPRLIPSRRRFVNVMLVVHYLGATLVLCVETHCHRPSRMTHTSV
jgi:hypothetical protein